MLRNKKTKICQKEKKACLKELLGGRKETKEKKKKYPIHSGCLLTCLGLVLGYCRGGLKSRGN